MAVAFAIDAAWQVPWWGWQIFFAAALLVILPGLVAQVRQKWKEGDRRYLVQTAIGGIALVALLVVTRFTSSEVSLTLLWLALLAIGLLVIVQAVLQSRRRRR